MNLAVLLSFYDEHPDDLSRLAASLTGLADQIIALDGAYALMPDPQPHSPPESTQALKDAASKAGITLHLHAPDQPWQGNEIQKRDRLFHLARQHNADWTLILDADEHITSTPAQARTARNILQATRLDVAAIHAAGIHPDGPARQAGLTYNGPLRRIFRSLPALHCIDTHWRYTDIQTGRDLLGPQSDNTPALDLASLIAYAHTPRADPARTKRAWDYYDQRAKHQIEGVV